MELFAHKDSISRQHMLLKFLTPVDAIGPLQDMQLQEITKWFQLATYRHIFQGGIVSIKFDFHEILKRWI